ncbi:uncharacterized protein METZ01_LOCUS6160, partial [marine metagenome]
MAKGPRESDGHPEEPDGQPENQAENQTESQGLEKELE